MQLQINLFENYTSSPVNIVKGDAVIVNKMIGGKHGTNAIILCIIEESGEKKYLLQFPDGVEFWTNQPSVTLKNIKC